MARAMQCLGHATNHSGKKLNQTLKRKFEMNSYNPTSLRSSVAAVLCTALFSTTCLLGALAPAQTAGATTAPAAFTIVA